MRLLSESKFQLYELSDDVKRKEWLDDWLGFMHRIGKRFIFPHGNYKFTFVDGEFWPAIVDLCWSSHPRIGRNECIQYQNNDVRGEGELVGAQ